LEGRISVDLARTRERKLGGLEEKSTEEVVEQLQLEEFELGFDERMLQLDQQLPHCGFRLAVSGGTSSM